MGFVPFQREAFSEVELIAVFIFSVNVPGKLQSAELRSNSSSPVILSRCLSVLQVMYYIMVQCHGTGGVVSSGTFKPFNIQFQPFSPSEF